MTNKSVWHTILPSTHFREADANPSKMKGSISGHVKIRALAFFYFFIFLWLYFGRLRWNKSRDTKQGLRQVEVGIRDAKHATILTFSNEFLTQIYVV